MKNKNWIFSTDEEYINSTNFMNNQNYIIAEKDKYTSIKNKEDAGYIAGYVWLMSFFFFLISFFLNTYNYRWKGLFNYYNFSFIFFNMYILC